MLAGVSAEYRAHIYLHHIGNVHGRADLVDLTIFIQEGEPIGLERVWS